MIHDALCRLIEGDFVALPDGGGGVHLHGIVHFSGRAVEALDLHGSGRESAGRVAARILGAGVAGGHGRFAGHGGRLFHVVLDVNVRGGSGGLLKGICHYDGDKLAEVVDAVVRERRAALTGVAVGLQTLGRTVDGADVAVMEDGQHAGHGLRLAGVNACDAALADGAEDADGVRHVVWQEVERVGCRARDLMKALNAGYGLSDGCVE